MTAFQQALLIVIIFICTYAPIDRICKCIEHCATTKAYSNQHTVVNNLAEAGYETKNKESGMD